MNTTTLQQPKILFVDDEENILKSLARLFRDEACEFVTASSGQAALDLLARRRDIAVIVSDQRMPGMSGAEFLEKAREIVPDAVRIMLTGYADVKDAIDAINRGGVYRYIAKPWINEEIVPIIREAAARYALVTENKRLTEIVHRQNAELQQWKSRIEVLTREQRYRDGEIKKMAG